MSDWIFAGDALPDRIAGRRNNGTLMLAGALPRTNLPNQTPAMWRDKAHAYLDEHFDGIVVTPERREGAAIDYVNQAEWERHVRNRVDVVFYYLTTVPPDVEARSTRTEFGEDAHHGPQHVVLCIPEDAELAYKTEFQQRLAEHWGVTPIIGLEAGLDHAISLIGNGAEREGGECEVPLHVWRTPGFQEWLTALKAAGNRLDGFLLERTLRPVPKFVLYTIAKVNVWVETEQRHKDNEWIIIRPDIAHVVLFHRQDGKIRVIGVREFRSTVRNPAGMVFESPGGSSAKPGIDPRQMAVDEVREEAGIELDPEQITFVGDHQLAATTTTHHAIVLMAELTNEQAEWAAANEGRYAGNRAETEHCALTGTDLATLFGNENVDWSQLGIHAKAALTLDADRKDRYTIATHATGKHVLVVLDALNGMALDTIVGLMAAGTTVVYAGNPHGGRGHDRRLDIATTLGLFADRLTEQGIDAQFVHLPDGTDGELNQFLEQHSGNVTAFGFAGDYGLHHASGWQLPLARDHGIPVVAAWAGSTPQPELILVNGALAAPDDGYVPFSRQWRGTGVEPEICHGTDYAVVCMGRLTPAAYYRLAGLMISGTHLIYGGAPITQDAPAGRIHITRTLELMAAKLQVAGVQARFTCFEERNSDRRRELLLEMARAHNAPLLAFVDDLGLVPGAALECRMAHDNGQPVVGVWAGSSGGVAFRSSGEDALDVDPASLEAMVRLRHPGLITV